MHSCCNVDLGWNDGTKVMAFGRRHRRAGRHNAWRGAATLAGVADAGGSGCKGDASGEGSDGGEIHIWGGDGGDQVVGFVKHSFGERDGNGDVRGRARSNGAFEG